jgi:filamentous hemagglutinin family protein
VNHTYRLVWNDSVQRYVPAPETAKSRGKAAGRSAVVVGFTAALLGSGAWASPVGGTVSAGSGSIAQNGSNTTITQGSQNLAINWASFGIAAGESVNFIQPNASAIALNRVLGSDASYINGSLSANGQVWILNPNGVLFGNGASVNVGGLVASTLSLGDAEFMAGKARFTGDGKQGNVVNQGSLTGGYVALLGKQVSNQGTITLANGTAALAAGDSVTLDFSGNKLLSVQVDAGTLNALAENKGLIRADNGTVILTASAKDALLDTVVNNEGVIEAKGIDASGGTIVLLGGANGGTVKVAGTLDASASGSHGGGFIETSGAHVQVADGAKLNTQSAKGKTGTWLVDPTDFTIAAGNAVQTSSGIGATTLANNLATTNVTLTTDNSSGSDSGDINVNAAVNWAANTTLTLNAYNNININAAITATGASAGLALNHGNSAATGTARAGTDYNVKAPITLSGANAMLAINGTGYTLLHSMAELDAIDSTGLGGKYALAQNLDASGTTYTSALVGDGNNAFTGTFAGLGHTLSNLTIDASGASNVGLFGLASNSVIRDVGLLGGSVAGDTHVGALAGQSQNSAISNAYATSSVSGTFYVGGLLGWSQGDTISDVHATGSVSGENTVGGLVGLGAGSTLTNVYATGNVTNTSFGGSAFGGLVGYDLFSTINSAYAAGNVIGSYTDTDPDSPTYGAVYSIANNVGGLVGTAAGSVISNAYATGSVSGSRSVGGLVGEATNVGTKISKTYATGSVTGSSDVGGLVGVKNGSTSVTNSLWNIETTGQASSAGGTGFTTTQMMQAGGFNGWDLASSGGSSAIWRIYEGHTAPLLRSFMTELAVTTDDVSKTYDGGTAFSGGSYTIGDSSANLGLVFGTAAYGNSSGKNVGSHSIDIGGLYSSQFGYDLDIVDGTATITPLALTNTGATVTTKTYDGTTAAVVTGGTLNGVISGDTVNLSGSGVFDNKNAGSGKTVSVGLDGADAGNYLVSTTGSITAATLTLNGATAASKTYDGTTATTVTGGTLSGVLSGDTVGLSGSGVFNSKNVGIGKSVTAGLSGADAGNYVVAAGSTTANITAAALTFNGTLFTFNKVYDGTTAATSFIPDPTLGGVVNGDRVSLSGNVTFADKNVGSNKALILGLTGSDAGNYTLGAYTSTARITAAALNVSGTSAASKTYDGTTGATLSGGSLNGLFGGDTVSLSQSGTFSDKNAATGKTVNYTSSISGSDAGNYVLIPSSGTTTADITAATLTVNGTTAANKTYDGTTAATLSGGALSGIVSGDTVTLAQNGTFSDKNAASGKTVNYTSSLGGSGASNYVLASGSGTTTANISAATLAVSGTTATSKTYDGTTAATLSGGVLSGLFGGDAVTLGQSGTFSDKHAQTGKTVSYTNSLSGSDASNYVLAAGSGTTTADITAATLAVNGTTAANKTYDGTTVATLSGGALSGVISGDSVTLGQSGTFSDKNVATGKTVTIGNSLGGSDASNYIVTAGSTTADIGAATLTVSGTTAANKIYDATTGVILSGGSLGGVISGDSVTLSQIGTFSDKNVGTAKTVTLANSLGGSDASNYIVAAGSTTANISAATLTVSGTSAASKTYDGMTTASLSGSVLSGVIAGDTVGLSQSGNFSDKNAATGKTVTYTNSLSGSGAGNYLLASGSGTTTADISAATLSVSGTSAANKVYDGTTGVTLSGTSLGGVVSGDSVTLSQNGSFSDKNAATGKTVSYTSSLSGLDANNYVLTSGSGTTLADITAATLTVNGTSAANKTYDATTGVILSGGSLGGVVSGDSVTLSQSGSFNNKNAGTGKLVSYTNSLSGSGASNYLLATGSGTTTADIAAATLTVSGTSAASKTYDGTTTALVSGGALSGVISGDSVALGQSGSFSDKNAALGKTVTVANNLSGSDAGNYVVAAGSTTADITAATLSVSGTTAANKRYDGTTVAALSGGVLGGVIAGDSILLSQSGSFSDKNAGTGKTVTYTNGLNGGDAGNYLLASNSGTSTADITPAALTVTANNDSRRVGGGAYSGGNGVSYNGLVNGESSSVLGGSLVYGGSAQGASQAGRYNISASGLSSGNYNLTYVDGTLLINAVPVPTVSPALAQAQQGLQASPPGSQLEPSASVAKIPVVASRGLAPLDDGHGIVRIRDCGLRLDAGQVCN